MQAVTATLIFIAAFSLGQGSVCWILLTEIVPSRIRAQAFSIFTAVNWLSNLFIGLYTLSVIDTMGNFLLPKNASPGGEGDGSSPSSRDQQKAGVAGLYAVFAILSLVAVAFIYFFVRETMGKSLEELEGGDGRGLDRSSLGHRRQASEDMEDSLLRSEHGGRDESLVGDGEDSCRVAL